MEITETIPITQALIRQLMHHSYGDMMPSEQPDIQKEQQEAIANAMQCLDATERDVILLRYEAEFSYQEIAQHLLTSPEIVEHTEKMAIERMRTRLPKSRSEIVSFPTLQYISTTPPLPKIRHINEKVGQQSVQAKNNLRGFSIDRAPIFAELNLHPQMTGTDIADAFHITQRSGRRIRQEWLDERKSFLQKPITQLPKKMKKAAPKVAKMAIVKPSEGDVFAYLNSIASPSIPLLAREFRLSIGAAQSYLRSWKAAQSITDSLEALEIQPTLPIQLKIEVEKEEPIMQEVPPTRKDSIIFEALQLLDFDAMDDMRFTTIIDLIAYHASRLRRETIPADKQRSTLLEISNLVHVAVMRMDDSPLLQKRTA